MLSFFAAYGGLFFKETLIMITVGTSEIIIGTIATVLAYGFTASIVGWFRAWVALQMGDDTPERDGYLTFNPFVHTDIIGFFCFIFLQFGWFKSIVIDKSAIRGKHAKLKQILAYYSDTITHIIFSFLGIIALVVFFGESARCALKYALSLRDFSCYYYLAQNAPNVSSFVLSLSFILFAFTRLNILLSGLTFAFNTLRYAFFSNRESIMSYNPLYYMLFSFLFFIFVARPVGGLVLYSGLLLSKCFIG